METVHTVAELRRHVAELRRRGPVALVPTMGNLHDGHLRLVEEAADRAGSVVVSLFVNPIQFNDPGDFKAYPRTLEADCAHLRAAGVALVFAPSEAEMYPRGREGITRVEVPGLSDILCGAFRPGHFAGVTTVVAKLFNQVQPDLALFGRKDFQQLMLIRRMVRDLDFPIEIVGVPTVREADGLAMSSRNNYLSEAERRIAPRLHHSLAAAAGRLQAGERDFAALAAAANEELAAAGLRPDYFELRRASDLAPPAPGDRELVLLAAAYLGQARLIDNLELTLPESG